MATQKVETRFAIPTLEDLSRQAESLRSDVEATALRLGRQARGFLPEQGQRGLDVVINGITDVRDDATKRVDTLRKDIDTRRKQTVTTVEREARKRVESLYKRVSLPVRGDLDAIKRRITRLERKIDQLLEEKSAAA